MNQKLVVGLLAVIIIVLLGGFYAAGKNTTRTGIVDNSALEQEPALTNAGSLALQTNETDDSEESTSSPEGSGEGVKNSQEENMKSYSQPFPNTLDQSRDYKAVIKTSMGDITVDLFEKESPFTVNNFVELANDNFYNGIIFHRIIEDFMIQGGDPTGTGAGGPGYEFRDEINDKKLVKGSLAMANRGPNTNGSQFFIVTAQETPWLDGKHTNFGQVTSGMDIVDAIAKVETNAMDKPLQDVVITSIEIIAE